MTPLSLTARTLYAELRELALAVGLEGNIGKMPGSLVTKRVRDREYLYFQFRDLSGHTRQVYVGPDNQQTRATVARISAPGHANQDAERLSEIAAAFVAAGGFALDHRPMKVIAALAAAGIFRPGQGYGVLVGTHAFNAYGNLLGVRWSTHMQTQDIDLAADANIALAIPRPSAPLPDLLEQLDMGFVPIPRLDARSPSTSFRVRGEELRLDLLAPAKGKPKDNVFVPALNAPAQPLPFLDFLIEEVLPVVVMGKNQVALVNVPAPERFALHKLLVSESRGAAFASKAEKDRRQAIQLLDVLLEESPDAVLELVPVLRERGKGWSGRFDRSLKKCRALAPEVVATLQRQES